MKRFSMIIGYREAQPDRRKNIEYILNYLKQYHIRDNFEVIVVEQDVGSKMPTGDFYRHFFLYNPGFYNRSWGFNVGANVCDSDIVIFCDSDLILKMDDLLEAVSYLEKYEAVNPKGKVYDVEENVLDPFNYRGKERGCLNFSGGLMLMKKDIFFKIKGWDEDFRGWGGEDDAMTIKINAFTYHISLGYLIFHLFHKDKTVICNKENLNLLGRLHELKQNKLKLLEYYKDKQIGDIKKYEN